MISKLIRKILVKTQVYDFASLQDSKEGLGRFVAKFSFLSRKFQLKILEILFYSKYLMGPSLNYSRKRSVTLVFR